MTDHDTVEGCKELAAVAAAEGIRSVAGIEVSAYCGETKFHTLGYGIDEKAFAPFLKRLYDGSVVRRDEIIFKLNKLGYDITTEDVDVQRFSFRRPYTLCILLGQLRQRDTLLRRRKLFLSFWYAATLRTQVLNALRRKRLAVQLLRQEARRCSLILQGYRWVVKNLNKKS